MTLFSIQFLQYSLYLHETLVDMMNHIYESELIFHKYILLFFYSPQIQGTTQLSQAQVKPSESERDREREYEDKLCSLNFQFNNL